MSLPANPAHQPFIKSILAAPDEKDGYLVYSDWLIENGDPRGELIQVQLKLENTRRSKEERELLKAKEAELLAKHSEEFLDEGLAKFLLRDAEENKHHDDRYSHTFSRGFLGSIYLSNPEDEFIEALGKTDPRLIRSMTIGNLGYETGAEKLFKNLSTSDFENCNSLSVGEYYPQAFDGIAGLIQKMPRLKELRVFSDSSYGAFEQNLPNIRTITMEAGYEYPIEKLAANKSLTQLKSLTILPHADDGDGPFIRLESFKAFCKATHFSNLESLKFHCTEFGNEGVSALVAAPFWPQLKKIDLSNGTIQELGALHLAQQDLKHLQNLTLDGNYISDSAGNTLSEKCVQDNCLFKWAHQFGEEIDAENREHLWEGCME